MEVVRYIFEMVVSGTPMWKVRTSLEAEGVPAPNGGTLEPYNPARDHSRGLLKTLYR
jgi:hypothetical protein